MLSLNGIVYANSARIGGDRFDDAIMNYVRRNYGILIGEATAERIKIEIGSAVPRPAGAGTVGEGQEPLRGRAAQLHAQQQRNSRGAAGAPAGHRQRGQTGMEQTPPELGADVAERGIVITGGGALLRDIDKLLTEKRASRW